MIPLDWLEEESHSLQHKEASVRLAEVFRCCPTRPFRNMCELQRELSTKAQSCGLHSVDAALVLFSKIFRQNQRSNFAACKRADAVIPG